MVTGIRQARAALRAKRKAITAFGLFAALSLAGIFTLFSQARFERRHASGRGGAGWTSLDPGRAKTSGAADLLPAAIEQGASPAGEKDARKPKAAEEELPPAKVLRLR